MSQLIVLDLDHWCARIEAIKKSFLSINFQHVYREHNMIADGLSKEALLAEFMEGERIF